MRTIPEIFAEADKPVVSFEFFPPKTPKGESDLLETARALARWEPGFFSVTYGAGGSNRDTAARMVLGIQRAVEIPVTAHITGVAHTKAEIDEVVSYLRAGGIVNLLALRGDAPKDAPVASPEARRAAGGFAYAEDLLRHLRARSDCARGTVGIAVAGYPEKHPEAASYEAGLDHLASKVAAGADLVLTQLFFDVGGFLRFRDDVRRAGVRVPIVPGILPITNAAQVRRFTSLCGAKIPAWLSARLDAVGEDATAAFDLGVEVGTKMLKELFAAGVPGVHFYTLNKSASVDGILSNLR